MMSVFGSLMGDMEDDPIFGHPVLRQMRQMNSMMNSLFSDPFSMMRGGSMFDDFDGSRALAAHHRHHRNALMSPFGMPPMPNFNRLLGGSLDSLNPGNFSSSSTVISMTSGPDGRPQVYKATSSTRVGPDGVKETQKTVEDSITGTKKMSIGHHIGERAHIIEKEQNLITGDREEREDLINIDEDEKEDFDKEWDQKTRRTDLPRISGVSRNRHSYGGHSAPLAITAGPSGRRHHRDRIGGQDLSAKPPLAKSRRSIRSSSNEPSHASRAPYTVPGQQQQQGQPRKSKNVKTVSGASSPARNE